MVRSRFAFERRGEDGRDGQGDTIGLLIKLFDINTKVLAASRGRHRVACNGTSRSDRHSLVKSRKGRVPMGGTILGYAAQGKLYKIDLPQCPSWVTSGHGAEARSTSALPPKSDIAGMRGPRPFCANSRRRQNHRRFGGGGGAAPRVTGKPREFLVRIGLRSGNPPVATR
jgi:hypothetical protein